MGRTCLIALGLALASLFSAAPANAAFVLIDNFVGIGAGPAGVGLGGAAGTSVELSGGQATFEVGDAVGFTGINAILAASPGLGVQSDTTIRLNGLNIGAGDSFTILASADGFSTFEGGTVDSTDTFIEFTFTGLLIDDLDISVLAGTPGATFTADAVYAVPEPTTMALIGLASCGGLVGFRRKRNAAVA